MHSSEIKFIKGQHHLSKAWGYRTGKNCEHQLYEVLIKDDYCIQQYTDIIFRVIQQLSEGWGLYPHCDIYNKVKVATSSEILPTEEGLKAVKEFVSVHGGDLRIISNYLGCRKLSQEMICFVYAAASLLFIADDKISDAKKLMLMSVVDL